MAEGINSFQSSWTLAEALIYEISSHLRIGRQAWLSGNLEKYYWEFETIARILYGMLDDNEKKEAKDKESQILNYLPVNVKTPRKELAILLKEYDGMIMNFLHKHKLDVPPKRDRTVMIA